MIVNALIRADGVAVAAIDLRRGCEISDGAGLSASGPAINVTTTIAGP
ncbi:hypothetical protein BMS3Bbin01_01840 [bacterium BMS3Bbin01]|nr:hypothetical protein BMS3Bbin01_01840 [bacterium BMS3Bbin01]